jgi:tetratricopeptide (TPR) repeat protein
MVNTSSRVKEANRLLELGQSEEALRLATKELDETPDDPVALYAIGRALLDLERPGLAQVLCKRAVEMVPQDWALWNNLGHAYQMAYDQEKAEEVLLNALRLSPRNYGALVNLSLTYVNWGKPEHAIKFAKKALSIKPDDKNALENIGLAYISKGDRSGWEYYDLGLGGSRERKERSFVNPTEPRWSGEKGQTVVAYADQGLGDEIAFAACLPALIRDCQVIIECDPRLENLFRRSFNVPAYGTRYKSDCVWPHDYKIDARVAFSSLPRFYEFQTTPYLVADPERRKMWRAILNQYPGKKIGVAWNGGIVRTGHKHRSLKPDVFRDLKGTLISLEYGEEKSEGIIDFSSFINTRDYDDTAALVSELDYVIAVTTSIVDLCGALGQECHVLVPSKPHWRYGVMNYGSVKLHRHNKNWKELRANLHRLRSATADRL